MPAAKSLAYSLVITCDNGAGLRPNLRSINWRRACESPPYATTFIVVRRGSCDQSPAVQRYSRRHCELDPKKRVCALPPSGVI